MTVGKSLSFCASVFHPKHGDNRISLPHIDVVQINSLMLELLRCYGDGGNRST